MDIIVGGGITGISYAAFCGHNDYLILEKDSELGGYCRTTKRNGFVWDYSGHFFHFQDAAIKEFVTKYISNDDIVEIYKSTYIHIKDRHVDYPFQKNIHQLSKEDLIDCIYDLFTIDKTEYSTFKEMLYVKFGRSIAELFLIPYNTKLYACDLDTLDKDAMGRFFPYAEKEDIIKNFKQHKNNSYNGTFVYPNGGAITYVESLLNRVDKNNIRTNTEVVKIDTVNQLVELSSGEQLHYDRLISTMPFPSLLDKAGVDYNKSYYNWNKVLVFNIGFDSKGPDSETHWVYFPEDKYCFYRVGFYSNILGSDRMSLYVELGFAKDSPIDVDSWFAKVLEDLHKAGIASPTQQVVDYESIVMNPAYVHINSNSVADVADKKSLLEQSNVFSIGRYGSWTYCSIEDNIKEAKQLALKLNK